MSAVAPGVAFVGRGGELDALAARLAPHDQPAGGVLLISGPAGVGKTRLIDEAVRRAAGPAVVRGYCPAETTPPLWPWRGALKRAGVEIAHGPDVEPAAAKSARFAALAQMSDALIATGPLTVVLEDLHWADAASLDLLAQSERSRTAPASRSSARSGSLRRGTSPSVSPSSAVTVP